MPTTSAPRARLRRLLFWVPILVSAVMIITWFTFIVPMKRSVLYDTLVFDGQNNPTWWQAHRRGAKMLWAHDDFVHVGENATKEDVPWIIAKGMSGLHFDSCEDGHRAEALAIITNQTAGETKEAWQQWWEGHKHASHSQWILKGFEEAGTKISLPLSHDAAVSLLKTIGKGTFRSIESSQNTGVARHIRTNALRLLRDVDFSPDTITTQEIAADSTGD